MKIACVGGGPASLYFSILMKKARPDAEITVYEQNPADVTWGFGVVFSDSTMAGFGDADDETLHDITQQFTHWDDIDIHFKGEVVRSTGHGFAGLARLKLLQILAQRARRLGIDIRFDTRVESLDDLGPLDLIVAGDGVNSPIRTKYAADFQPEIAMRPNKFIWLGANKRFDAFNFYFKRSDHGLWRAHCYQYDQGTYANGNATIIVETTEETWKRAGLAHVTEEESVAFCENLFERELDGASLISNRSEWRTFPELSNRHWSRGNIVLLGDALHTAHFSIGSGTKLAMEDAISLSQALTQAGSVAAGLALFEAERRPDVISLQRAARVSMKWFEETERYYDRLDPPQFAFSLLTRSLRINHENLRKRDPNFVRGIDQWFADRAAQQSGVNLDTAKHIPPAFTPFKLRDLVIANRIAVSPMCMYSAEDGTVNDWHLVHLGSRAVGGAGLVIAEMTDVSPQGRISPGCAGMYKEEHVGAWRKITDFVHRHSASAIALQLGHAGRKGSTKLIWEGDTEPLDRDNWGLLSPSGIPYTPANQTPREMTADDMALVKNDFVRATEMADAAGFDMIELHMAHGYLLSSFLSPLVNQRTDAYGGSLENRMRYPLEVFAAIRAVWPAHKPLSVRVSGTDWAPGGATPEDAVHLAAALKRLGCDIVDVSSGQVVADQQPEYGRLYQTPFADQIRLDVDLPTMTVGNIQSYGDINAILAGGRADICVLARAHLFDPYYARHAAAAMGYALPQPPQYRSIEGWEPRLGD